VTSLSRPVQVARHNRDVTPIEQHDGSGDIEGQAVAYDLSKNPIVPIVIAKQQRRAVLRDVRKSLAPKEARAAAK
jgi:hypothetical protein